MGIKNLLILIASSLVLIQGIPYIKAILERKTIPNRATYGIWLLTDLILLISYIAEGATKTVVVPTAAGVITAIVFVLSFKYGTGGTSKLDLISIILAILAIIGWLATKNPAVSLYLSILAGELGYPPLWKKLWQKPRSENTLSWTVRLVAGGLNIFALNTWQFSIAVLPIVNFIGYALTLIIILYQHQKAKMVENPKSKLSIATYRKRS